MNKVNALRGCLIALTLTSMAGVAEAAPELRILRLGYQVTQLQPVPGMRRTYYLTARASIINLGDPAIGVAAQLSSSSPYFRILDGDVSFGDVPPTQFLRPVLSHDTFRLRITVPPRKQIHEFALALQHSLVWTISCTNCGNTNRPPVANAGTDQTVYVKQAIVLDGSTSTDPDGQPLTFDWSFVTRPAGSSATLSGSTGVTATFIPDREGDYVIQLVVSDGQLRSAPDTAHISTLNSAPVAHAGGDSTTLPGETVILDGTASSDVDGDPLTYAWSVTSRPAGSLAEIVNPSEVTAQFTPDVPGQYLIELTVDDGTVSSAPDTVTISTSSSNAPPIANAGPDLSAQVGDLVQLDGTASSDADGDPLTYAWSLSAKPADSAADLQDASTSNPSLTIDRPGTYIGQLIVRDGTVESAPDTVSVSTVNTRPTAVAGASQIVHWKTTVELDGSASSDPDGDALAFTWSILSRPVDSNAVLSAPYAIDPTFVTDRPGLYVVQLVVGDGTVISEPSSVSVTATNQPPIAVADSAGVVQNVSIDIPVLANDGDPDGDALSIESVTQPSHGATSISGASIHYAPVTGYVGSDNFTYRVSDGAASASATVSLTVTAMANRGPTANAGPDQTVPGGSVVLLDGSLSSDPDSDALAYQWALQSKPSASAATLIGADTATPQFTADKRGPYGVSLTVTDGRGGSATDTVDVTALNRDPVAHPDTAATPTNTPVTIDVLANDSDLDGDALTIASITQPPNGAATNEGTSVTFTPVAGFSGATSFSYTISDGNGGTGTALISVEVTPSDLPELSIDDLSVPEGDTGTSTAVFTVTLSAPSAHAVSVSWTTSDGDATAPSDYAAASGVAQIASGDTTAEITAAINGDTLPEADETLYVRLSNAAHATIADSEGGAVIVDDDPTTPTSFDLISQALADGLIDDETALIYSVYAEFQDPRLPAAYRGRADSSFEAVALREAGTRFDSLSPPTQATLAPFLELPDLFALPAITTQAAQPNARAHVGAALQTEDLTSAAVAATTTTTYDTLDLLPGVVRVGWDANSPVAEFLALQAQELKAEFDARIWPKLTVFLGTPAPGRRILILLAEGNGVSAEDVNPSCTLARIWLYQVDPWVFVHELAHALIDLNFPAAACNKDEKLWMHEATATWAQHYVYPPADQGREQTAATYFLREPERSLSTYVRSGRGHQYGAYLWFLRLAGQENNPGIVRAAWQAGAGVSSLQGIENVLQSSGLGGFKDQWPKFALDNWNRQPPYRKYQDWDRLSHKASQGDYNTHLAGRGWDIVPLDYNLPILSATYLRINFDSDPDIRGILVLNSAAGDDPNLGVHAIVKLRNQPWRQAEDWSAEREKYFCRDNTDQDVEEVILVISNRGHDVGAANITDNGQLNLYYSALPCVDWTGHTTYRREERPLPDAVTIRTVEGNSLRFRADLTQNRAFWRAIQGTIVVRVIETSPFEDGSCTGTGTRSFDARDRAGFTLLPLGAELEFQGHDIAFLPSPPTFTMTYTCSSSSGTFFFTQELPFAMGHWFESGPDPWPVALDATTIVGSYPDASADERWTWEFTKAEDGSGASAAGL